jgi:hypothetical protein
LAIANDAAVNIHIVFLGAPVSVLGGIYLAVELLHGMVMLFESLKNSQSELAAVLLYMLNNSVPHSPNPCRLYFYLFLK